MNEAVIEHEPYADEIGSPEATIVFSGIRNEMGEVDKPEQVSDWREIVDPVAQGV